MNTCPQCHQDTYYFDGTPTHRHDVFYGYFGLTLCALASIGTVELQEAQQLAYRLVGGAA